MYGKLNPMNIFGIHLDFPFLRVSQIKKTSRGIEILWTKTLLLSEGDVKPLYIENFKGKIVSCLSSKDFLIRSLNVKISSQKHAEEAIAFQSEALSHFKPGETFTVPVIEKREKGKTEALLFTVSSEGMKRHLEELEKLGVDPDGVSTLPSALCHFVRWKFPTLTDAFIVEIGSGSISCVSLENGKLKKAHAISTGIEDLLSALYEDRKRILLKSEIEGAAKQIDLLILKSQLNPRLSRELNGLRQELSKIYCSFTRGSAKPILFTGRVDAFIHLKEFLFDFSDPKWTLTPEEQNSAASLGLCIEQTTPHPLQLRRGAFFPRKNWIRLGRIALLLLAGSTLLSGAFILFGLQGSMRNQKQMLSLLQTPSRKKFLEGKKPIDHWIQTIENQTQEYPYILQAPKVAEILAWISLHPLLQDLKREGDPIDIQELRVQLLKFPSIHLRNEDYLEKVEMEFSFKSAMNARKFHEALRQDEEWVSRPSEITWDVSPNGYRTSFYLKNRGPHVVP